MCDHDDEFEDEHEDEGDSEWRVWRDSGAAFVEWTDLPIFLFKVVEEVGTAVARLGNLAGDLFKSHANERSRRKFVGAQMARELERIVGGE